MNYLRSNSFRLQRYFVLENVSVWQELSSLVYICILCMHKYENGEHISHWISLSFLTAQEKLHFFTKLNKSANCIKIIFSRFYLSFKIQEVEPNTNIVNCTFIRRSLYVLNLQYVAGKICFSHAHE